MFIIITVSASRLPSAFLPTSSNLHLTNGLVELACGGVKRCICSFVTWNLLNFTAIVHTDKSLSVTNLMRCGGGGGGVRKENKQLSHTCRGHSLLDSTIARQ